MPRFDRDLFAEMYSSLITHGGRTDGTTNIPGKTIFARDMTGKYWYREYSPEGLEKIEDPFNSIRGEAGHELEVRGELTAYTLFGQRRLDVVINEGKKYQMHVRNELVDMALGSHVGIQVFS